MVKPSKKKGGKKDAPKESSSQSAVSVEEPTISTQPEPEAEDDVGLTGGARKKRDKKEKKEKALQALQNLQATRKPPATATASAPSSETASETTSRAVSEAPSEAPPPTPVTCEAPSVEPVSPKTPSEPPAEPPKVKLEPKVEEVEESGLGLSSSKKRKPRKKKADASQAGDAQPAPSGPQGVSSVQQVHDLTTQLASTSITQQPSIPTTPSLVQMPESPKSAPAGPWGRSDSAGKGRGWGQPQAQQQARPSGAQPSTSTPVPAFPQPSQTSVTATGQQQQAPQQISVGYQQRQGFDRPQKSLEPVLCRYKIPTKIPGCSVRAIPIRLMVNYLEMEFKALQISRYDVSFCPDRPKRMLSNVFQLVKKKHFRNDLIAFDQMKNCYSLRPLKNVSATERFHTNVEILDQNGKTMNFDVSIKATGVVDLRKIKQYMATRSSSLCHPTEEIQCIDVILRQGALESYVKAGRQFFKRPANPVDLGYGYEMWTGLFQSAIFTNKSFINIDVAHKGFPKAQSLLDALVKDFNMDPSRPLENQRNYDYFVAFVKGLRVIVSLVGDIPSAGDRREFVCNALAGIPEDLTFIINDPKGGSRKTTVADYFSKDKKYKLKYPKLNCLWVGPRDRTIYFPIELVHVVYGQPLTRQLNDVQVSKMVKEAATPPDDRLKKITEVISNMKYSQNPDFKSFGLDISDKFYTVAAKILEPPTLDTGSGKIVPRRGQWQANRLLKPEPLQSWGLIAVDTDPRIDYDSMISMIMDTATKLGMRVEKPKIVNINGKMKTLHSLLMNAYKDVRFIFIIVSARGRDDYHKVKQMAEREVGILTQCVKEMTARRMNPMTAKNILLKVNSKLMGINQAIDNVTMPKCLRDGGVMIVGADVTHPSPDQSNVPSIAAVTASLDPKCYIYNIELSIQTPKKEMIVEFEDMMFDHLRVYKERNQNTLPEKIFVFRDGVSEGQFAQVMNSELLAVHNAYARLAGTRKPEVLFLLVQKRHHTRLFNVGRNQQYNVEPGTVVDTDIVHASELDFYLVSHQAIKGTARPTRYHAVCNDGKIPDDEVEQLTYYLCHLYSRCMRSVSYPTPTYYAHLACLRARSLTYGERFDNRELERKPKRLHVLDKMLQYSRMFFV